MKFKDYLVRLPCDCDTKMGKDIETVDSGAVMPDETSTTVRGVTMWIFATDDKTEFDYAFKGLDYLLCLWDLDQWLRSKVKYGHDVPEEEKSGYEKARQELWNILDTHGVSLDDLE